MTPQLQMAIRMLQTPASELGAFVDELRATAPDSFVELPVGEPDPYDELERAAAIDEEREPYFLLDDSPLPAVATGTPDVWVFGNPPQARANGRAFPRFQVVDGNRDARWLVRAFRQRAKTYERVVSAMLALRPAIAIAMQPEQIEPVKIRDVAEAVGMHESTIDRVARACRFQTIHGLVAFAVTRGRLGFRGV